MSVKAIDFCRFLFKTHCFRNQFFSKCAFKDYGNWRDVHKHASALFENDRRSRKAIIKSIDFETKIAETKQQLKQTTNVIKERFEGINENVFTFPNALCLLRIGLTPALGHFIVANNFTMAFALFSVAGITDLLDGYIARNFQNQQSVLGSFLDPFADKLLVATLFATLTYTGNIPVPLTAVILLRDVLLISGAAYLRYKSLPAPRKISRYFDFKYATVQISPTTISKINTAFQLSVVASTLTACLFGFVGHPFVTCLYWTTAGTTVASGISYLMCKNTYKYIRIKTNSL